MARYFIRQRGNGTFVVIAQVYSSRLRRPVAVTRNVLLREAVGEAMGELAKAVARERAGTNGQDRADEPRGVQ